MSQSASDESKLEKEAEKYDTKARADLMKSQKYQKLAAGDDRTYQHIMKTAEAFDKKLRNAMRKVQHDTHKSLPSKQAAIVNPPALHRAPEVRIMSYLVFSTTDRNKVHKSPVKSGQKLSGDDLKIEQALKEVL